MKKMLKKITYVLMLSLLFTACGGGGNNGGTEPTAKELAIAKITAYATEGTTVPTLQDYLDAGVSNLDATNLEDINEVVENLSKEDVDTTAELQALADALGVTIDTESPVITLIGTDVNISAGDTYTDEGATATDNVDGDLSATIVTSNTVDTTKAGTYTVTYDVNDTAGNNAQQVARTVNVALPADVGAPVITLKGTNPINLIVGDTYTDAGATANDTRDGNVTQNIRVNNTVDTTKAGTYTVTYDVNDTAENSAVQVSRTVTVNVATTITHKGTTYGFVTSPYTGKVWLDKNLGAARVCESFNDTACYGDYYQWGRNFDGHQDSTSGTTATKATDVNSAGNEFIKENGDWASVDASGATRAANWSKTDGTSVCPVGYRVPSITELRVETLDNGVINRDTAFTNFLKLPSAGDRNDSSGSMSDVGSWGGVWSSSASGSYLGFVSVYADWKNSSPRASGFSVRCLRD